MSEAKSTKYGTFTVHEFISEDEFKMVDFDPKDLDTAFKQNPGVIVYFGHQLGKAKRQTAQFKTIRDAVMSKVSKRLRDQSTSEGGKAWAETRIESEMRSDREFIEVSYAANHALEVETTIEALYWAARGRRNDMEFFAKRDDAERSTRSASGSYTPS